MSAAVLFAHAGGWDEVLFVGVPIGIFAVLLMLANKRAAADEQGAGDEGKHDADRPSIDKSPGRPDHRDR